MHSCIMKLFCFSRFTGDQILPGILCGVFGPGVTELLRIWPVLQLNEPLWKSVIHRSLLVLRGGILQVRSPMVPEMMRFEGGAG